MAVETYVDCLADAYSQSDKVRLATGSSHQRHLDVQERRHLEKGLLRGVAKE